MGAYKAFRDVEEFIDINGNSKRLCQLLDEKVLRLADAYELAVKEAQRKERVFEPFTQPLEKRPAKETGVGRKAREARETIVKLLYDERISAGHDRVRSSVAELRALVDEARGQWEAAFAAHRKAMVNQLLNPQMADQDAVKSHPAPGVASASNRAEPAQDAPIRSVNRKTPETLQFEGAVHTAMTDVWNNWKFNHATDPTLPEPNKGDMHGAALNMLINSGIKSARKHPTLSMVRDAATAWHKPQPVKVTVSPSVAPPTTTRHAFKGEK